jgi:hypothetical protein
MLNAVSVLNPVRVGRRRAGAAPWGAAAVLCALAGCVIYPGPVSASLSGRVVDAETGGPIAGAHLYFGEIAKDEVVSSADGQFSLAEMRKWHTVVMGEDVNGGRMLTVEAPGYPRQTQAVNFSDAKDVVIRLRKAAQ